MVDSGLINDTDLVDWALIDFISKFYASPKAKLYKGHVWINYKNLISEMPLCKLSTKQSVSRRISKLRDLNLITTIQCEEKKLYARITQLCYSTFEGVNSGEQGVNSEITGCQFSDNIKQTSKNKPVEQKDSKPFKPEKFQMQNLESTAWNKYCEYRKKILKKPLKSERGCKTQASLLVKHSPEIQHKIVDQTIDNEWIKLIELKSDQPFGYQPTPVYKTARVPE